MSFEKQVLSVVAKVVKQDDTAAFTYGTLFVPCTSVEAAQIETKLIERFKCGIIVSKTPSEFAFDFI